MSGPRAYLDHNASAPLRPAARAAMLAALDASANPSSVHAEGRGARRIVEEARAAVAALAGASAENVVFTSGATEAASLLLTPYWRLGRAPLTLSHLYVAASDHACLVSGGRFAPERVTRLPVDAAGLIRLDELRQALAAHDATAGFPLVAIHLANNETGVIQPAAEIAAMVKAAGGVLVLDAVQAAGRLPLDMAALGADFLILSSHKLGGPIGAGAVVGGAGLVMPTPLVTGGGQERGHRAGTENLPAIAGFGAAARDAMQGPAAMAEVAALRDRFEAAVLELAPGAVIVGGGAPRLPNTLCFALPGTKAETAQIAFDLAGVALSAGSACSSGKVGPSHVLAAMGLAGLPGALRVSIGRETGEAELLLFVKALAQLMARRQPRREAA